MNPGCLVPASLLLLWSTGQVLGFFPVNPQFNPVFVRGLKGFLISQVDYTDHSAEEKTRERAGSQTNMEATLALPAGSGAPGLSKLRLSQVGELTGQ